jgi:hypothetical protein
MTDVRCPMCSKLNPPDQVECQFCKARLKPLIQNPSDEAGGSILRRKKSKDPVPAPEPEEVPDWLSSLRDPDSAPASGGDSPDLPEWMSGDAPDSSSGGDIAGEADLSDWLSRLGDDQPDSQAGLAADAPDETAAGSGEAAEEQDWLASIRSGPVGEAGGAGEFSWPAGLEEPPQDEAEKGDLPDWLAGAGVDQAEEPELSFDPQSTEETEPGSEDWFASFPFDSAAGADGQTPVGDQAEELPDWLSRAGSGEAGASPVEFDSEPAAEVEDWFASSPSASALHEQDDPSADLSEDSQLPDWLSGAGAGLAEQAEDNSQDASLPDWLVSGQLGESSALEGEAAESSPWLSKSPFDLSQEGGDSTFEAESEGQLPDWLSGAGFSEPSAGGEQQGEDLEQGDVPDWLAGMGLDQPTTGGTTPAFAQPEDEFDDQGLPDWLSQGGLQQEDEAEYTEKAALPYSQAEQLTEDQPDEEYESPILGDLPDWLNQVSDEEAPSSGEAPPQDAEVETAPAELPGWLEAMRPVETFVSQPAAEDRDAPAERVGPLAGLRSVLPAEAEFREYKKAPAYSVKLQVTESQQLHSEMLESLLESENEARPLPPRKRSTSQLLLRLLIAAFLIIPLALVRWMDPHMALLPTLDSDGAASQTLGFVDALAPQAPVLVAFDYEPGLAGELDVAAAGVIQRIYQRQGRLALVSTLPDGPVNAERFLGSLNVNHDLAPRPLNLGYISGGAAGLRTFAENPRSVFPYTVDTLRVWESDSFRSIQTAADFALVIVITENPATARAWIEQTQPILQQNNVPLVMVVSSQAEPLVRPYYAAYPRQVAGLIAGVPGGALFESQAGMFGRGGEVWNAYSLGLLVAVVFLSFGGLFSAIMAVLSQRKDSEGE